MALSKTERRQRIKSRIRKVVVGTPAQPRLAVFRSNNEIYAQIVDDTNGVTLVAASSRDKEISTASGTKSEKAVLVGKAIAEKEVGICTMVELNHWLKELEKADLNSKKICIRNTTQN